MEDFPSTEVVLDIILIVALRDVKKLWWDDSWSSTIKCVTNLFYASSAYHDSISLRLVIRFIAPHGTGVTL